MRIPRQIMEARIRAAQQSGALDDLPGKGKPLPRDVADDFSGQERFDILLGRSTGAIPEEVVLLREIEILRGRLQTADDEEAAFLRRQIGEKELRLSILHEASGRNLSASRVGAK